ncbi:MAG: NAD(P)-dependent oxidoreductase [Candidatus Acidiferrales bacterium]
MGDIGLQTLEHTPGVSVEFFSEFLLEVSPNQLVGYDAVISLAPRYTSATFAGTDINLSLLARFGVGYDMVDVQALTNHDVMLTITPDGVRRPMAAATITLLLALANKLLIKDRLVREGRWSERGDIKATGLTGRVLGLVGLGNIGRDVLRLLKPFEMVHLATDPFVNPADVADLRVELVDLETLMRESDFVSLHCPLTPENRKLIGERELSWMKPTSYLINTSRGPIIDQSALYRVLKERRISGAGLDVYEAEPVAKDEPIIRLDNVILAPHSLCWTDECFRRMGEEAVQSVLAVAKGEIPRNVVNREVLQRPGLQVKLKANAVIGS